MIEKYGDFINVCTKTIRDFVAICKLGLQFILLPEQGLLILILAIYWGGGIFILVYYIINHCKCLLHCAMILPTVIPRYRDLGFQEQYSKTVKTQTLTPNYQLCDLG